MNCPRKASGVLPSQNVSRLLDAIERIHTQGDFSSFHLTVFNTISDLIEDVKVTMDSTRLKDGTVVSRNTEEGKIPSEMQNLLVELIPENPALPAIRSGARGLLAITDFTTQRQFERTRLYNEIMRPNRVRYELLIPLELPGHIATVTINRNQRFLPTEVKTLYLFASHVLRAYSNAQTITRLRGFASDVPEPAILRNLGLTCRESEVTHWLIHGKRNSEIATILGTSTKTVTKHLERIFTKLCVETRTAAALVALERTAISSDAV